VITAALSPVPAVLGLAALSVVSTAAGVGLAVRLGERRRLQSVGIGFSVGVMVTIAVTVLLPEAASGSSLPTAVAAAAAGAVVLAGAHLLIPHRHLVDEPRTTVRIPTRVVYLVAVGLILHDVPEGFAMAEAYELSPRLGVVVAVAILVHNVPEEFAMALPAVMARRWRFLAAAAVASAAAEPAGAALGLLGTSVFPALTPVLLAFAAGAMVFVSFHELVPVGRAVGRTWEVATGAGTGALMVTVFDLVLR